MGCEMSEVVEGEGGGNGLISSQLEEINSPCGGREKKSEKKRGGEVQD